MHIIRFMNKHIYSVLNHTRGEISQQFKQQLIKTINPFIPLCKAVKFYDFVIFSSNYVIDL